MRSTPLPSAEVKSHLLIDQPHYRVDICEPLEPGIDGQAAYRSYEFQVVEADAPEVIAWAQTAARNYRDASVTVYAAVTIGSEICLVRIFGVDPTRVS